ncbi:MAG: hypothetical protein KDE63_13800 [Novosphingobium sp.]|nr:hypothetical protein [Novosphingobium sp.]
MSSQVEWTDYATLHRKDDGEGVLYSLKAIRHGTLAELVAFIQSLPDADRDSYVIEKSGDHRLGAAEIRALAARSDYPG